MEPLELSHRLLRLATEAARLEGPDGQRLAADLRQIASELSDVDLSPDYGNPMSTLDYMHRFDHAG